MSFEHEWPLTVWPTRGEVEQALAETVTAAGIVPPDIYHEAFDEVSVAPPMGLPAQRADQQLARETIVTIMFAVPVASAVDVALRLDPLATRESYASGLEKPRGKIDWDAAERAGALKRDQFGERLDPENLDRFMTRDDYYALALDLVAPDDEDRSPPRVCIYSHEADNRAAIGIIAVIATYFADRLEKLSAFS
jgi:hypothetical protein